MTPSAYWVSVVKEIEAKNRIPYVDAWQLASRTHPEASILMQAYGATKARVQFYNSKLAASEAPAKSEAKREFQEAVQTRMKTFGCSYDSAFNFVQSRRPDLTQTISRKPSFANTDGVALIASPQTKAMLCLPMDATQEEFDAALAGNGGALAPRNPGKIFAALVNLEREKNGIPYDSALAKAKSRFPMLWLQVEAIVGK